MDRQLRQRSTSMAHTRFMNSVPTSRRTFLGAAAGLAAAAQASNVWADDGGEVRVAVIGTGARGSDLIRALTTIDGAKVVALADDYEPHLAKGAEYAGPQAQTFRDYRKLLEDVKPQAVVIAVPLVLHSQVAHDALQAGCDVFCEKTMCYTVEEARRLATAVKDSGRVFQVGLQRRANPIYDQAAAIVQSGLIGQVTAIKCQWHRNNNWRRPLPVAKSDPAWQTLEHRLNWRLYRDSSAGLMAELGSHQIDVANWVLGTTPKRVIASGGIDYWRDGREVFDNIFCVYEYEIAPRSPAADPSSAGAKPYTVRVTYSSLCNNAYEGASELVLGTRGTLFLTSNKGLLYREKAVERIQWASGGESGQRAETNASVVTAGKTLKLANDPWAHRGSPVEIDTDGDDTRAELVSFIDHVRRGDPATICDVTAGLFNTATVLIANESASTGAAVDFPRDLA